MVPAGPGTAEACGDDLILGLLALGGRGVPQDDAVAAEHFRRAAEQGGGPALYFLADAHRAGRGVARDEDEAARLFKKAQEVNSIVGELVSVGHGLSEQHRAKVVGWLRSRAAQGERWADDLIHGLMADADLC